MIDTFLDAHRVQTWGRVARSIFREILFLCDVAGVRNFFIVKPSNKSADSVKIKMYWLILWIGLLSFGAYRFLYEIIVAARPVSFGKFLTPPSNSVAIVRGWCI